MAAEGRAGGARERAQVCGAGARPRRRTGAGPRAAASRIPPPYGIAIADRPAEELVLDMGEGMPLEPRTASRFAAAYGADLGGVRVHTGPDATALAAALEARAFTLGGHVGFASGAYRPGTPAGDAVIAHELAHVLQQRGAEAPAPHERPESESAHSEREAATAAVAALGLTGRGGRRALRLTGGRLRLSRWSKPESVPNDLGTVEAKAEWIRKALAGSASLYEPPPGGFLGRSKGRAIVDVLSSLSAQEFIDIQSHLDMSRLLDELTDFEAVRLGTLGPVEEEVRARVNRLRVEYLVDVTRDRGPSEAEVTAHWMFASAYGDDIREVLTLLAGDQHLHETVDNMPAVLELFRERGVDRKQFQDRSWETADVGRALIRFAEVAFGSSEAGSLSKAIRYLPTDLELPEPHGSMMQEVRSAEFAAAVTPGRLALGALDRLAFSAPSSVIGVVTGTVSGVADLAEGQVEAGVEKLTGSVIFVLSLALGVRAFRRSARMAALLETTSEGQAALAQLRPSVGEAGIQRVARYVQADSKAAFFVRKHGLVGIEALEHAAGDVNAARRMLKPELPRIPANLSSLDAATAAKQMGLPDPPAGYRWSSNGGRLTVARARGTAKTSPKLVFDPETRTFRPDRNVGPARPDVVQAKPPAEAPAQLEQAASDGVQALHSLESVPAGKAKAGFADGTTELSGWGNDVRALKGVERLSERVGHTPEPSPGRDAPGKPGSYNLSHAEKKLAARRPGEPIGVSEGMCPDCQVFFQKLSNHLERRLVVADPSGVRVFAPRAPIPVPVSLPALVGAASAAQVTEEVAEDQ